MGFIINENSIIVYESKVENLIYVCDKVIKLSKKYKEIIIDVSALKKVPLTLLLCLEDSFNKTQLEKIIVLIDEKQATTLDFFEIFINNKNFEFKVIKREQ